jgi:hypothetical protein
MRIIALSLLALFFVACTSTNQYAGMSVGYDFPVAEISEDFGHRKITVGVMTLDYDYMIDRQAMMISCDGFIEYFRQGIPGGSTVHGMKLTVLFLDSTRTVIASDTFFVSGHRTTQKNPFERRFPFDPQVRYMTFTYSGYVD